MDFHNLGNHDEIAASASFDVEKVGDPARMPFGAVLFGIAVAALVVGAIVGENLASGRIGLLEQRAPSPVPPSPSPSPSPVASLVLLDPEIPPGPFSISDGTVTIRLTMPAGWRSAAREAAVYRPEPRLTDWSYPSMNGPSLAIHPVARVATDICLSGPAAPMARVGPGVKDLVAALATLVGPDGPRPSPVMLDGYRAERYVFTDILDRCGGPEGRILWEDAIGEGFGLLKGGTGVIFIVSVDGRRLVIATHERGAEPDALAELAEVVASIVIEVRGRP